MDNFEDLLVESILYNKDEGYFLLEYDSFDIELFSKKSNFEFINNNSMFVEFKEDVSEINNYDFNSVDLD